MHYTSKYKTLIVTNPLLIQTEHTKVPFIPRTSAYKWKEKPLADPEPGLEQMLEHEVGLRRSWYHMPSAPDTNKMQIFQLKTHGSGEERKQ